MSPPLPEWSERKLNQDGEVNNKRWPVTENTQRDSKGRARKKGEWKREILSILRHGWGVAAARTLLFQIQSDLQLNQLWRSDYRAGRDQTRRQTLCKRYGCRMKMEENLKKKMLKLWIWFDVWKEDYNSVESQNEDRTAVVKFKQLKIDTRGTKMAFSHLSRQKYTHKNTENSWIKILLCVSGRQSWTKSLKILLSFPKWRRF